MKIPDFKNKSNEKGEVESNQETFYNLCLFAVSDTFSEVKNSQQGEQKISTLSGSQGRVWGRIQRKIEDAMDKESKTITLETAEIELLKKAFENAKFPISWFKWSILIEDALDEKNG